MEEEDLVELVIDPVNTNFSASDPSCRRSRGCFTRALTRIGWMNISNNNNSKSAYAILSVAGTPTPMSTKTTILLPQPLHHTSILVISEPCRAQSQDQELDPDPYLLRGDNNNARALQDLFKVAKCTLTASSDYSTQAVNSPGLSYHPHLQQQQRHQAV